MTVRPDRFDQQMRWLRRLGFHGASMSEVLKERRTVRRRRLVGLTFDDGYADFVEYALPTLQRYGFTATVFVLPGRLGGENSWDPLGPRKALMTADQLRLVAEAGMEIGSHGLMHVSLPGISDAELTEEVVLSRRKLQQIVGQDVVGFCYPYGHLGGREVSAVQAAGYEYACAIGASGFPQRHALRRTYIYDMGLLPRIWARNAWGSLRDWRVRAGSTDAETAS